MCELLFRVCYKKPSHDYVQLSDCSDDDNDNENCSDDDNDNDNADNHGDGDDDDDDDDDNDSSVCKLHCCCVHLNIQ